MQRSVSVQRLHVVLDYVVPLHAQVNEASGLDFLSFSIEDVMPGCLVLDCCNQSFGYEPLTKKQLHSTNEKVLNYPQRLKSSNCTLKRGDSCNRSNPTGALLEWFWLNITMSDSRYNLHKTFNMIKRLRHERLKMKMGMSASCLKYIWCI